MLDILQRHVILQIGFLVFKDRKVIWNQRWVRTLPCANSTYI